MKKKFNNLFKMKTITLMVMMVVLITSIPSMAGTSPDTDTTQITSQQTIQTKVPVVKEPTKKESGHMNIYAFEEKVKKEEIQYVIYNSEATSFTATTKDDKVYIVPNPGKDYQSYLVYNNVEIKNGTPNMGETPKNGVGGSLVVLFFVFILIYMIGRFFTQRVGGGAGQSSIMGQTKMNVSFTPQATGKTFDDIIGLDETKEDLKDIVKMMRDRDAYIEMGADLPKGIILTGSPGTGKTLMAKAIAGESKMNFISVSGSSFVEMFVGVGASRIRDLFAQARANAPCIIFIDEIDALGKKRGNGSGGGDSEREQTLNQFLVETDGTADNSGILVIGATNRLDMLDDAFIRSGRFDKTLNIPNPNVKDREKLFKYYGKNKKVSELVNFKKWAKTTVGFSPADIENVMKQSAFKAVNNGKSSIEDEEINEAFIEFIVKGKLKKNENSPEQAKLIAYHEGGHALATKIFTGRSVDQVTIIGTTSGAGGFTMSETLDNIIWSKDDFENQIKISMGGRIAEVILYQDSPNKITAGASADMQSITKYAKSYVSHYGMDDEIGMVNLSVLYEGTVMQSEMVEKRVVELVKRLSKEVQDEFSKPKNKRILDEIAEELLDKETLFDEDINEIIARNL